MGDLRITNLTVTFGDFYIFKLWDLRATPAIVIGMDMIGTLDTFGVDYLRREVQIRVRTWPHADSTALPTRALTAASKITDEPRNVASSQRTAGVTLRASRADRTSWQ